MLNVLILTSDTFPPFRPDTKVLFGDMLSKKGHHIDMIIQSHRGGSKHTYDAVWNNLHITVTPTVSGTSIMQKSMKHLLGFLHDFRVFNKMRRKRYDFLQVKDKFLTVALAIAACKIHKTPFVYWLSFSIPETYLFKSRCRETRNPLLFNLRGRFCSLILYRVIPHFAMHIFVQSAEMKKDLITKGIPAEKLTPIPMGVSKSTLDICRNQGIISNFVKKRLIYIGSMDRPRHLDFLLRVFRKIIFKFPETRLYMVGSSHNVEDMEFLESETHRLGLSDQVIFTGFIPREEVLELIQSSEVCFSPMYPSPMLFTTTPTKCMEYLGIGRPVIGNSEIPDIKYVLTESGGGICVPWNEKCFADAAIYLLEHPEEAEAMGRKGQGWIFRNREYSVLANLVENEYYRLLGKSVLKEINGITHH